METVFIQKILDSQFNTELTEIDIPENGIIEINEKEFDLSKNPSYLIEGKPTFFLRNNEIYDFVMSKNNKKLLNKNISSFEQNSQLHSSHYKEAFGNKRLTKMQALITFLICACSSALIVFIWGSIFSWRIG